MNSNSENIKISINEEDLDNFKSIKNDEEDSVSDKLKEEENKIIQNDTSDNDILKKKESDEFKIGNYLIQQTIGEGTFGKVKLGLYIPGKEVVAIKILEKRKLKGKDDEIRIKREFEMISKFEHPNVIMVTEIFENEDSYFSVMEYCSGGELFNYIVKKRRLKEKEASFFYYQIISGLEYIHSLGIVHRDLKPENLLLTKDHLLKIIDFGLSNYFNEDNNELLITPCGSPCYASPEMVVGKKYNGFKTDIWSTGIILYAMLCGYLPFEDKDNDILFKKILGCKINFPENLCNSGKDLIQKILVKDPNERITINNIKKHPFYLMGKKLFDEIFTIQIIHDDFQKDEKNNFSNQNKSEDNKKKIDLNKSIQKPKDNNSLGKKEDNINTKENNIEIIENNKEKSENKSSMKIENNKKEEEEILKTINVKNKRMKNKNIKRRKNEKNFYRIDLKNKINIEKIKEEIKKIKNIHKDKENTIDKIKERNTIGAKPIELNIMENSNDINSKKNITNFMVNNINYNVNISLEDTKILNSDNNQSILNNNKISKTQKNNNIKIEDINLNNKISKINNYLSNYNFNSKINKNNKYPNKIKKKLRGFKSSKNYIISDNFKSDRDGNNSNICKYLLNNSKINTLHKVSLLKKFRDKKINNTFRIKNNLTNFIENINKMKIKKLHEVSLQKSISKIKNIIKQYNTINFKKNISKLINRKTYNSSIQKNNNLSVSKEININIKKILKKINGSFTNNHYIYNKDNIISSIKACKSKKIFKKSLINKNFNNNNKLKKYNNNYSQQSMEVELSPSLMQTDPNLKNNQSNLKIKLNSQYKNNSEVNSNSFNSYKKIYYNKNFISNNKKYIHHSFKYHYYKQIQTSLLSPIIYRKKVNNPYKEVQILKKRNSYKDNNLTPLFSLSHAKKQIFSKTKCSPNKNISNHSFSKYSEKKSKSIDNKDSFYERKKNKKNYNKKKIFNNYNSKNVLKNLLNNNSKSLNNLKIINKLINRSKSKSKSTSKDEKNNKIIKHKILVKGNIINNNFKLEESKSKVNYIKKKIKINYTDGISKQKENKQNTLKSHNNNKNNKTLNILNIIKKNQFKFNKMRIGYKSNKNNLNYNKTNHLNNKIYNNNINEYGNLTSSNRGTINYSKYKKILII